MISWGVSGGERDTHRHREREGGREREKENMQKQAPGREGMERENLDQVVCAFTPINLGNVKRFFLLYSGKGLSMVNTFLSLNSAT